MRRRVAAKIREGLRDASVTTKDKGSGSVQYSRVGVVESSVLIELVRVYSRRIPSSSLLIFASSALLIVRPTLILVRERDASVHRERDRRVVCGLLSEIHLSPLNFEHVGFDRFLHDETNRLNRHRLTETIDTIDSLIL